MNVFEAVKQSVTTRQAAEHYGIRVGRNGMCVCPFHDDKNPSMKVDRRFHCFGCQADGDVIDFVSRLENVSPKEAALMLAQDFSVPYEDREPPGRSRRPKPRQESPEQQFKRMERHCFRVLSDYHNLLHRWKRDYAPKTPDEEWLIQRTAIWKPSAARSALTFAPMPDRGLIKSPPSTWGQRSASWRRKAYRPTSAT